MLRRTVIVVWLNLAAAALVWLLPGEGGLWAFALFVYAVGGIVPHAIEVDEGALSARQRFAMILLFCATVLHSVALAFSTVSGL